MNQLYSTEVTAACEENKPVCHEHSKIIWEAASLSSISIVYLWFVCVCRRRLCTWGGLRFAL